MKLIRLSDQAEADVQAALRWLLQRDRRAAKRWADKVWLALGRLAENPFMGSEYEHLLPSLRYFTVGQYVIYYRPMSNGVEVFRIIHGARDVSRLFPSE